MTGHQQSPHGLSALAFAMGAIGWLTPQIVIQGVLAAGTLLAGVAAVGRLIRDIYRDDKK